MPFTEADTRAQLIDPQLEAAGWAASQIGREHCYRHDAQYTDGRIFRLPPFLGMGQAPGVVRRFGSTKRLQQSLGELERRIYA